MRFVSVFFFSSRRRHTRYIGDWSSDVCSSDLPSYGWRTRLAHGLLYTTGAFKSQTQRAGMVVGVCWTAATAEKHADSSVFRRRVRKSLWPELLGCCV